MEHINEILETFGIFAVFALCTVEGDITLLLSGVMAHSNFFGPYSFWKVVLAGTLGGIVGDNVGYWIGRLFRTTIKDYGFYKVARPRIERLIDKFGGFAIIISKYIYGIRAAMCLFYGIGKMPYLRFLFLDAISAFIWALLLASVGYFFSGAITSIIGDFKQIGIALFFIVLVGIIIFYVVERYYLSEKVEEANPNPETIHKFEEKLHNIEEAAQDKLYDIGERLHLTSSPDREEKTKEKVKLKTRKKTIDS
ncbi:MAG: DedA family protein [Acidobacteria bacterium]|jgi:membrane protein DedA with SNARE-associated domain|nr:DedA family protein [Acidobacteriota bacterium]